MTWLDCLRLLGFLVLGLVGGVIIDRLLHLMEHGR